MLLLLCAVVGGLYKRHAPEAYMVSHKLTWRHSTEGWQLVCISILDKPAQICLVWLPQTVYTFMSIVLVSLVSTVSVKHGRCVKQPCVFVASVQLVQPMPCMLT